MWKRALVATLCLAAALGVGSFVSLRWLVRKKTGEDAPKDDAEKDPAEKDDAA